MENYSQQYYINELRSSNSRRVAVLGNGIVSNLAAKLIKDTIILTKKRTDLFLNNIFFHDTIENRMMLNIFNIEFTIQKIPVYYYNDITGESTQVVTDEIRIQIAKEKMGDTNKPIILSTITDDKPDFINLSFDENQLTSELISSTDVITIFPTKIIEFPNFVRLYFDKEFIDFDYLINTIPQPAFAELIHSNLDLFKSKSITFVTTETNEEDMMTYSYNDCFWKRKFIKNKTLCIEFNTEDFDEDIFHDMFPEIEKYSKYEISYGRIKSYPFKDSNRIKHIGRFAQWDHRITTEHSINKLLNLNL